MKKQMNVRVAPLTQEQFDWLMEKWGTNQVETLTICVDRVYREENPLKGIGDFAKHHQGDSEMKVYEVSASIKSIVSMNDFVQVVQRNKDSKAEVIVELYTHGVNSRDTHTPDALEAIAQSCVRHEGVWQGLMAYAALKGWQKGTYILRGVEHSTQDPALVKTVKVVKESDIEEVEWTSIVAAHPHLQQAITEYPTMFQDLSTMQWIRSYANPGPMEYFQTIRNAPRYCLYLMRGEVVVKEMLGSGGMTVFDTRDHKEN